MKGENREALMSKSTRKLLAHGFLILNIFEITLRCNLRLVVSTQLKNMSENGSCSQKKG